MSLFLRCSAASAESRRPARLMQMTRNREHQHEIKQKKAKRKLTRSSLRLSPCQSAKHWQNPGHATSFIICGKIWFAYHATCQTVDPFRCRAIRADGNGASERHWPCYGRWPPSHYYQLLPTTIALYFSILILFPNGNKETTRGKRSPDSLRKPEAIRAIDGVRLADHSFSSPTGARSRPSDVSDGPF